MKKSKIRPTKLNPLGDKPVKDLNEMEKIQHFVAIIREDFDSKIEMFAEVMQNGFEAVNRRIDGLEYAMNIMRKDILSLDGKMMLLANKMDKVSLRVDDHEARITDLEAANS